MVADTKIGIIIQARLGSTRLPKKMIIPFYKGKSILQILIADILKMYPETTVVLATTTNPVDDVLIESVKELGVNIYRGSENNVLKRFVDAAMHYELDYVVRICADNPFLDVKSIGELLGKIAVEKADYTAWFFDDNLPSIKSHSGRYPEGVSVKALHRITNITDDSGFLEHVTNYIYANPDSFSISRFKIKDQDFYKSIRLTVDTQSDFDIASEIYNLYITNSIVTESGFKELVLGREELVGKMKNSIAQNGK